MRWISLILISGMAWAQSAQTTPPANAPVAAPSAQGTTANDAPLAAAAPQNPNAVVIPGGSKIPLTLKQAISTKNAREGDAVYAETAFPFVHE